MKLDITRSQAELLSRLLREEAVDSCDDDVFSLREMIDAALVIEPIPCKVIVTFDDDTELHYANCELRPGPNGSVEGGDGTVIEHQTLRGFETSIHGDRNTWDWDEERQVQVVSKNSDPRWAGKVIVKEELELPDGKRVPS